MIIHQTLYNLFPPSSMDPTLIAPLTSGEFIQRILVPEVGVRLIMEDMGLKGAEGMKQGIKVLRESANYGVAMFPEDGGEWGGGESAGKDDDDMEMGVGDLIIMERARKRRKELEEEEREEDELWDRQQAEREKAEEVRLLDKDGEGIRRNGKGKKKEVETDVDMDADADTTDADALETTRSRPKPRPKPRPKTRTDPYVPTDTDTDYSDRRPSKNLSREKENKAVAVPSRPRPRPLANSKSFASSDFDDLSESGTSTRSTKCSNTKLQPRSQSRNEDFGLRDASNSAMDISDAARTPKVPTGSRTRSTSKQRQIKASNSFQKKKKDTSGNSTSDSDIEVVAEEITSIGVKHSEFDPSIDDVDTTSQAGPSKGVGALSKSTTFPLLMARKKKRNEAE